MLIANLPIPKELEIPRSVQNAAHGPDIEVADMPSHLWGSEDWISCAYAWPHTDPMWKGKVFITLSVLSTHSIGDAKSKDPAIPVPAGSLFVIDPTVTHWLCPQSAWETTEIPDPWIGIQWIVPKRSARALAHKIVKESRGKWIKCSDPRYSGWKEPLS